MRKYRHTLDTMEGRARFELQCFYRWYLEEASDAHLWGLPNHEARARRRHCASLAFVISNRQAGYWLYRAPELVRPL